MFLSKRERECTEKNCSTAVGYTGHQVITALQHKRQYNLADTERTATKIAAVL